MSANDSLLNTLLKAQEKEDKDLDLLRFLVKIMEDYKDNGEKEKEKNIIC